MSLYGYDSAVSAGNTFSSQTQNYNDGVLAHNQELLDKHKAAVKSASGNLADDTTKRRMDEAFYGMSDGKGTLSTGIQLLEAGGGIKKQGFSGFIADSTKTRLNTIATTVHRGLHGEPKPEPVETSTTETGSDGTVSAVDGAADDTGAAAKEAGKGLGVGADAAADAAKVAAGDAAKAAGGTIESSGLGTSLLKGALGKAGVGKAIGEAGLSTLSEIGGKAIGDFGGLTDIAHGVDNLVDGKNFFEGEDTGSKFQEAGAVLDLAGTAFPPLELLGGAAGLIGGLMDGYKSIKSDLEQKKEDQGTKNSKPPPLQSFKVSPAYSSLGLVASAPVSAKAQIVGGSSF
jgi:hypothetical protein